MATDTPVWQLYGLQQPTYNAPADSGFGVQDQSVVHGIGNISQPNNDSDNKNLQAFAKGTGNKTLQRAIGDVGSTTDSLSNNLSASAMGSLGSLAHTVLPFLI